MFKCYENPTELYIDFGQKGYEQTISSFISMIRAQAMRGDSKEAFRKAIMKPSMLTLDRTKMMASYMARNIPLAARERMADKIAEVSELYKGAHDSGDFTKFFQNETVGDMLYNIKDTRNYVSSLGGYAQDTGAYIEKRFPSLKYRGFFHFVDEERQPETCRVCEKKPEFYVVEANRRHGYCTFHYGEYTAMKKMSDERAAEPAKAPRKRRMKQPSATFEGMIEKEIKKRGG
jgi:hypothetical protein